MKLISLLAFILVGSLSISQQQITFSSANNNTTIATCNGFIIDSGGQGGPGYSNNENVTITICPDTVATGNNDDFINIIFNLFNLDTFDDNPAPNQQNLDVMYVYDGPSTASPTLGSYTGNGLANTTIQATNLNPSGCITLQFVSNTQNNAGNWQFTASATCATPCDPPVALGQIVGGDAADSIRVCVGDLVDFIENGSFAQPSFNIVSYEWNFMDGTTAPGSQGGTVSHAFTVPGHYVVNLYVTDDNQDEVCQNANLTELNVFVANPPTFYEFPTDTTLCIGESIDLVAQPQIYDSLWSGFIGSTQIDNGCLYDTLLGVAQVVPIQMTGFDQPTITDAGQIESVCLDMEHSYMGDLVIQVQCPDGTIVTLHQQGGGGTQIGIPVQTDDVDCLNGLNQGVPFTYCFTPTATETWVDWVNNNGWGQTLPAGDYSPVQPLSGLVGCPISGTWNLIVTDNWGADDGTVFGWSINLVDSLYPDVIQFEPHVGDNSDSSYWDNSGSFITNISPDGNIATVVPTASGMYQYTYNVWDDYGCFHDSSLTITVDPQILISAGADTSICNGELVQLGDDSGGSGATCDYVLDLVDTFGDGWNGNTIDVTIGGVTTNYSPSGNGQVVTLSVTHGDNITLQWNGTGSWQSENEIYLYDPDGNLIYSDGTNFSVPTTLPFSTTADCYGGLIFSWTPNDGSLDDVTIPNPTVINPTTTTTYTLAVYPVGHPQCATTDDVLVSIGGGLDAGTDSTKLFCFEGAPEDLYNYLGGTPQLGGQWYNPIGQAISMPIQPDTIFAGLYEYRRDSSGCTASAFIDVSITQIDVSAIVNNSDCNAFNGEVQLVPSNTLGTVQFSNDNGVTFQNSDTFIGGMGSGNIYSFLVQDSVGCIATIDTIIIDDNFPVIDVSSIETLDSDCGADNGQVTTVTTNGGTPNYTYSVDGITVGFNALPLTNLPPSTPNTFDLIVQDNFGCQDTAQIAINEINTPFIDSIEVTQISCYTIDDAQIVIDGVNLQSFSIDGGITIQNSNTFTNLSSGTYDVIAYSGQNGTLCSLTNQIVILDLTPLQIDTLSADISACPGDELILGVLGSGGNGNYTYDWDYLGNNLGQGSTISIVADFAMQVCVTMSEDCPSPTTTQCMNITTAPDIYPALMPNIIEGCYPLEVEFMNITNNPMVQSTDWVFSDDGTTITEQGNNPINYVFENPGVFSVDMVVNSVDGCVYDTTYSQLITVYDHPVANFLYTPNPLTIYETEAHFTDYSVGQPTQWNWNFGSGAVPLTSNEQNPKVVYPEGIAAIYPVSLYITNEFGCVDSLISQVQVNNDVVVYAPNVFTPDNDQFNQTWRVYISGIDIYEYHLIIFNRWGEIVWESYNPDAVWKGTYGTDDVQDGTYVWVLNAKDSYNDKKYEFRGTVSVLR